MKTVLITGAQAESVNFFTPTHTQNYCCQNGKEFHD